MFTTNALFNLGPIEIIAILVVALLIFGRRLPEVGKSLGRGIVEFKKGLKGVKDELDDVMDEVDKTADDEQVSEADSSGHEPSDQSDSSEQFNQAADSSERHD